MRRTAEEAAETRNALLRAALAVFAERGYAAATLAGIAARAGVTRGAAYHHFTDKATLYLATISELWAEAATPVWGTLDGDGPVPERIRRFLVAFFTALERDATLREVFALSMRSAEGVPELEVGLRDKRVMMEGWKRGLMELLAGAALREGISAETAALSIMTSVNGTAATWLACPGLFSPADQAAALADAILHGLTS
ncbi:TetR/AcrR family transcriptional regulator [Nonomuraea basaltis]|uniref:TetR/AcrR family transcriptional regulator n=1 Tax=Nonomuraea basaltis TaxID=2495887 RepID=UPI00110C45F2|nr:TetR/AcrR family transcriptional regulator [Nonomuraea basaltis]TMR88150.1 TetR family transcriptional regulator [Nonomuraea basaltis]